MHNKRKKTFDPYKYKKPSTLWTEIKCGNTIKEKKAYSRKGKNRFSYTICFN